MIQTAHTPGCPGHELVFITARDRNRRISRDRFTYLRCGTCGLVRLAKPPEDLGKFYPNTYYDLPSRRRLAEIAFAVNEKQENIGARRLYTVMERLLDDISFHATRYDRQTVEIDAAFVDERLAGIAGDDNLARYIL